MLLGNIAAIHCVKSVHICSVSVPYFTAFGLNTERRSSFFNKIAGLRSPYSECGKIQTRKPSNTDIFHAVIFICLDVVVVTSFCVQFYFCIHYLAKPTLFEGALRSMEGLYCRVAIITIRRCS